MRGQIKGLPRPVFITWASLVAAFWVGTVGGAAAIFLDQFVVGVVLLAIAAAAWLAYGPWMDKKGLRQEPRRRRVKS